jgi:succinate dehydrogenase / fumarate reductase cytochrome b subunit
MPTDNRPTSPHLSIYRPQISTVLSILHRFTGLALVAGAALMATWLASAAYAPGFYATLHNTLASPAGEVFLFGWTAAFYYHLSNGIRHLFWDIGMGFTLPQMHRSGWAVILLTVILTALTWGFVGAQAAGQ